MKPFNPLPKWNGGIEKMERIQVDYQTAVATYNQNMVGVDLLDGLLNYYRIPVKSKKWYHRLFGIF